MPTYVLYVMLSRKELSHVESSLISAWGNIFVDLLKAEIEEYVDSFLPEDDVLHFHFEITSFENGIIFNGPNGWMQHFYTFVNALVDVTNERFEQQKDFLIHETENTSVLKH